MVETKTAAVLVIGNEILSGRTHDKNGNYIAQKCTEIGVNVREMRVVPDIASELIEALNALRHTYDYVFTTGGIGPTHDDITAECVAQAFGVGYGTNAAAFEVLQNHYKDGDFNEARQKMAKMPIGAELINNPVSAAPGFRLGNVFVMAGVPKIMQAMLDHVLPLLETGKIMQSKTITTNLTEGQVATALTACQEKFPQVDVGSYPFFQKGNFGISLVVRSQDEVELESCAQALLQMLEDLGADMTKTKISV